MIKMRQAVLVYTKRITHFTDILFIFFKSYQKLATI